MNIKKIISIAVAMLVITCVAPVYATAQPALPHAFYGTLTVNVSPATGSYTVMATDKEDGTSDRVRTGILGNPVYSEEGWYASEDPLGQKLVVQGEPDNPIADGTRIYFFVNGFLAGTEPAVVEYYSGTVLPTRVDLTVTIPIPVPSPEDGGGGGGGGGPTIPPPPVLETNLFGSAASYSISATGEILQTITGTSADGNLTITIPAGTIALDAEGNPLTTVTVDVDPNPSSCEGAVIIGVAYNFGPPEATFSPPITLEFTYDPADIPEGIAEEDLVVAYYDEEAGECVELPSTVNPVTNTITASVSHFTTFVILGYPPPPTPPAPAAFSVSNLSVKPLEVEPKEVVTISVSVANTGGTEGSYTVVLEIKGVQEAEESVTVAAGSSRSVSFTVSKEDAGSYSVVVDGESGSFTVVAPALEEIAPPEEEVPEVPPAELPTPINWPVVGGIIAGVIVVGLLIFFLVFRRRAA